MMIQRKLLCLVSLVLICVLILQFKSRSSFPPFYKLRNSEKCEIFFSEYKGNEYYNTQAGSIGNPKCLVESKWLKLSQHSVKFPGTNTVFDDWVWIDYHDRINVLVEDRRKPGEERQFLVFEQSKYALEGRSSLAIIGGIIEPGENPEDAAKREVEEEMNGLQCDNFYSLGRYRTDVNRGMGWLHGFLATDCSRDSKNKGVHSAALNAEEEVGAPDTERQDLKSFSVTRLRDATRNGEFLEVQWTMTVSLALIHPELME
jgi:ADP-ribose pyrophosphatase YjhB (NUDIX family)